MLQVQLLDAPLFLGAICSCRSDLPLNYTFLRLMSESLLLRDQQLSGGGGGGAARKLVSKLAAMFARGGARVPRLL
jgi:hypothetical protein